MANNSFQAAEFVEMHYHGSDYEGIITQNGITTKTTKRKNPDGTYTVSVTKTPAND